jgi:hypothetical protein
MPINPIRSNFREWDEAVGDDQVVQSGVTEVVLNPEDVYDVIREGKPLKNPKLRALYVNGEVVDFSNAVFSENVVQRPARNLHNRAVGIWHTLRDALSVLWFNR